MSVRTLAAALAIGVCAASAADAQFVPDDIWLLSPSAPEGDGTAGPAAVRIDPATWATTTFPLTGEFLNVRAVYDPARDRIVFSVFGGLRTLDPAGAVGTLPAPSNAEHPAAGADGRIYYSDRTFTGNLGFLDGADVAHTLLAADGVSTATVTSIDALWYDDATNSLFAADDSVSGLTRISRLTLNAAGDQVVATDTTTFDVSAASEIPVGFSVGPNGSIFLKVDDNDNAAAPRMLLIDPATLAVTTWAISEYFGVAGETAGVYSPANGAAVVLDSLNDQLRTFAGGQSGEGTIVLTTGVSSDGGSGERAQMIVIPDDPCPSDLSADGVTDGADLGLLLGAWGTAAGDLNGDGTTDGADLGILLGAWGACA